MNIKQLTPDTLIALYTKKQYPLFTTGDYNLNIFGIRSPEDKANTFNDIVGLFYQVDGEWIVKAYPATTDPGLYYRLHPMNVNGTAILKEGHYSGAFKLGYHQGKYQALVQAKPLTLYRDNNKDAVLDREGKEYKEVAGVNIHHASSTGTSQLVDKWSAGCQVIASIDDWNEFITLVNKSAELHGSIFSYSLFNELDL